MFKLWIKKDTHDEKFEYVEKSKKLKAIKNGQLYKKIWQHHAERLKKS